MRLFLPFFLAGLLLLTLLHAQVLQPVSTSMRESLWQPAPPASRSGGSPDETTGRSGREIGPGAGLSGEEVGRARPLQSALGSGAEQEAVAGTTERRDSRSVDRHPLARWWAGDHP